MIKIIILILTLFLNSLIYAQRMLPNDVLVGILKSYNNSQLIIEKKKLILYKIKLNRIVRNNISPVCIIKNELDRFIVFKELKNNIKKPIAYKLENNKIKYIWILTDKEYKQLIKHK